MQLMVRSRNRLAMAVREASYIKHRGTGHGAWCLLRRPETEAVADVVFP